MGPPPSCPIKLWYIHSAVANTYKEEIESFFSSLAPSIIVMWHKVDSMWRPKKGTFLSLCLSDRWQKWLKIFGKAHFATFHKSSRLLKRHTWNWISWSYLCYYMYYILHTASKRKHYHLPAHEIPFGREHQQQRNTSNTEQKSLSCYVFSSISFLVIFLHITWLWYDDGTLSILSKAFVFTM